MRNINALSDINGQMERRRSGQIGLKYYYGRGGVTDVYVPNSVSYISDDAFLTIHGSADSYAKEYAEKNWINYVIA